MQLRIETDITINESKLDVDTHLHVLLDGFGYEFIPLLRWASPWRFVFNSDAYAILLGVPLNTLVIYCGVWLGLRLLQKARRNSK